MKIYDLYEMSGRNLWRRKLRSGLTILGVVIGTASIVMMFSLSEAMNVNYENQMNQWGQLSLIEVTMKDNMGEMIDVEELNDSALDSFSEIEGVEQVMPSLETSATLKVGDYGTMQPVTIVGYDIDEMESLGYQVESGRMYEEGEEDVVIVGGNIGEYLVKKGEDINKKNITSGRNSSSGQSGKGGGSMMPGGRPGMSGGGMQISGSREMPNMDNMKDMMDKMKEMTDKSKDTLPVDIYNERAMITFENFTFRTPVNVKSINDQTTSQKDIPSKPVTVQIVGQLSVGNTQTDGKLFVPRATLNYLMTQKELQNAKTQGRTPDMDFSNVYDKVQIKVEDSEQVGLVRAQIEFMGYQTSGAQDTLDEMKQMSSNIQVILLAIGAISLIVASIGITNTMMTSIYERTKEIGIMKVIGATIKDIKKVFLVESAIIGLVGGVLGISICYVIAYLLNTYGKEFFSSLVASKGDYETYVAVITPYLAIGSVLFSTMIGIMSGYMPAKKATKLSALSAMRNE